MKIALWDPVEVLDAAEGMDSVSAAGSDMATSQELPPIDIAQHALDPELAPRCKRPRLMIRLATDVCSSTARHQWRER